MTTRISIGANKSSEREAEVSKSIEGSGDNICTSSFVTIVPVLIYKEGQHLQDTVRVT